jgi:hypothetical protein
MQSTQPELPMKDVTPPKAAPKKAKPKVEAKKVEAKKKPPGKAVAVAEPPAQREAKSVLAIIADAAANPSCNPENMRALLDMQKEIMAEQSRRDFNDAFVRLQAELPRIRADRKIVIREKDSRGGRTGNVIQATPYATFQGIMKAVQPLLSKHKFGLSFATEPMADGRILVRGFLDGYGHRRESSFPMQAETSGSKNNIQGWGSSQSYGKRYCTVALLNIISEAIEDADVDGHDGDFVRSKDGFAEAVDEPKLSPEHRDDLRDLIVEAGLKEKQFCVRYGIDQVGMLPERLFTAAVKAVNDYKATKAAKHGTQG